MRGCCRQDLGSRQTVCCQIWEAFPVLCVHSLAWFSGLLHQAAGAFLKESPLQRMWKQGLRGLSLMPVGCVTFERSLNSLHLGVHADGIVAACWEWLWGLTDNSRETCITVFGHRAWARQCWWTRQQPYLKVASYLLELHHSDFSIMITVWEIEIFHLQAHSPNTYNRPELGPDEARCLEPHPGLSCGWSEPKHLGHLLLPARHIMPTHRVCNAFCVSQFQYLFWKSLEICIAIPTVKNTLELVWCMNF